MHVKGLPLTLIAFTAALLCGCSQQTGPSTTSMMTTSEPYTTILSPNETTTDETTIEAAKKEKQILSRLDTDLDQDGFLETLVLFIDTDTVCKLTIEGIQNKETYVLKRDLSGPGSSGDFPDPNQIDSMRVVRIGNSIESATVIALQFSGISISDPQLILYQANITDGISLGLSVPYTVDTGSITLADANLDGIVEQKTDKEYVVRYDWYDIHSGSIEPTFFRSDAKLTFDLTKPEEVIRAWLYYRYNQIDENLASVISPFANTPSDLFAPFASVDGSYMGIAFTDASRDMYTGLPSAQIDRLKGDSLSTVYRISDYSEYSDRVVVGYRLKLTKQLDNTWRIDDIQQETPVFVCTAVESPTNIDYRYQAVFLTDEEMDSGYQPLLTELKKKTGIHVLNLMIDGDRCTANLNETMTYYFNQGSTGARLHVESLVRTILDIPGILEAAILVNGQKQIEMDHYSFDGIFMLSDDHMLRLDPYNELSLLPEDAESAVTFVAESLKIGDYTALSRIIDPEYGLRLSRDAQVHLESDPIFDRVDVLSIPNDEASYLFFRKENSTSTGTISGIRSTKDLLFQKYYRLSTDRMVEMTLLDTTKTLTTAEDGFLTVDQAYPSCVCYELNLMSPTENENEKTTDKRVLVVLRMTVNGYRLSGLVALPTTVD